MSKAEKFIEDYTSNCSNVAYKNTINGKEFNTYYEWLTPDQARRAVEIARDELMENVCQFIQEHHHKYASWNTEEYELEFNTEQFIQDIKQLIKDE